MLDFPPFPGFRDEGLDFLRQLKEHNDRDWFKPRKVVYKDEVQWPLQCLVLDAARQAAAREIPLTGDPKRSLFRIYRDTRFAKDKRPYKTHAGAILSRNGTTKDYGVLYIHVEPGQSFMGAGFWRPETNLLRAWRARLAEAPAQFEAVLDQLEDRDLRIEHTESLKRMPRGFQAYADTDLADHFRAKSFLVRRAVNDDVLQSSAFTDDVVQMAEDALPLLAFGWDLTRG